jgi:hypothetical protein
MGQYERAIAAQREALRLRPDFPVAALNLGLILLLLGQDEQGWELYEARFKCEGSPTHNFRKPLWDGRPLQGRRILLFTEQGLGDSIQFARFIPQVASRGGQVLLLCQNELKQLLATAAGVHATYDRDEPLPDFDFYAPLLSLPRILGVRMSTMHIQVPYLSADAEKVQRWREQLQQEGPGKRIGLVWAGSPSNSKDAERSIALSAFAPLAAVPGTRFYSLQKGPAAREVQSSPPGLHLIDHTAELQTMADTAALIENLDLVIAVDTAVCHLAGALGKLVWTLTAAIPHWGLGLQPDHTPWYPTMRLFRQQAANDGAGVIQRVAAALGSQFS